MARRRKDKKEENATLKAFKKAREAKKKEKDSASKKASDSAKITDKNKKMESKQPKDDFDLKKLGSNKASTKELLGKLSINKKPAKKESVTSLSPKEKADIKAAISLKAKTKKPSSEKYGGSKPSSSVSQTAIKVTDPENSSKTIHSPSSNMEGISSLSSISERLQEQLVDTNKKNWRDLMQEIRDRH